LARPKTRDSYHHGDLKRALVDAAVALITEGGIDHFTMAKAARAAGVSSGAPYRHFPDRHHLLVHLAREGAEMLDESVDEAMGQAGLDPTEQLLALGEAHARFAIEHPAHYRVMHAPEYTVVDDDEEEVDEQPEAGPTEVEDNGHTLRGAAEGHRDDAVRLAAQAMIYGFARMLIDGHFPAGQTADEASAALREMLRALVRR
jgi:AcrR family transcriptional regulator